MGTECSPGTIISVMIEDIKLMGISGNLFVTISLINTSTTSFTTFGSPAWILSSTILSMIFWTFSFAWVWGGIFYWQWRMIKSITQVDKTHIDKANNYWKVQHWPIIVLYVSMNIFEKENTCLDWWQYFMKRDRKPKIFDMMLDWYQLNYINKNDARMDSIQ